MICVCNCMYISTPKTHPISASVICRLRKVLCPSCRGHLFAGGINEALRQVRQEATPLRGTQGQSLLQGDHVGQGDPSEGTGATIGRTQQGRQQLGEDLHWEVIYQRAA